MIRINLLPFEYRPGAGTASEKVDVEFPKPVLIGLGVAFSVLLILIVLSSLAAYRAQAKLQSAQARLAAETDRALKATELEEKLPEIRKAAQALSDNITHKIVWWEVLEQLARSCPPEIRLTKLRLSGQGSFETLVIEGTYKSGRFTEQVFVENLKKNEKIRRYFNQFNSDREVTKSGTNFTVYCIRISEES